MSLETKAFVRDTVRTFNKYVLNPAMLHLAGRKHWYAGVIRHTGRRSGKSCATPVVAEQVAGGFIVPLPYGKDVDWLRSLLAAGHATITIGGQTYDIAEPAVLEAAAAGPQLSPQQRRTFERFGIGHFVKVRSTPQAFGR